MIIIAIIMVAFALALATHRRRRVPPSPRVITIEIEVRRATARASPANDPAGPPTPACHHVLSSKLHARNELSDENRYSEVMKDLPLGRAAKPREIGDMAAFLASDRSAYTSGVIITIDGAR